MDQQKNPVLEWRPYLNDRDYDYLGRLIEDAQQFYSNEKIVILYGKGQPQLIDDLKTYLGATNCAESLFEFAQKSSKIKMLFLSTELNMPRNTQNNEIIKTVVKILLKQQTTIVAATADLDSINNEIMAHAKIIYISRAM
jgi:hypothetical protein